MKLKYNRNMTVREVQHYAAARLLEVDLDDVYDVIDYILKETASQVREALELGYENGLEDAKDDAYMKGYGEGYDNAKEGLEPKY